MVEINENPIIESGTKELFQYLRKPKQLEYHKGMNAIVIKSKNIRVGIMYAVQIKDTSNIGIGFTRFNYKKEPSWNDEFGLNTCIERAYLYYNTKYIPRFAQKIPKYVKRQFKKFITRTERYFQNCIIPEWSIRFRDNIKNPMFQKIREKTEDASKLIEPTVEVTEEIPKEII